jgi:hypothetical protein
MKCSSLSALLSFIALLLVTSPAFAQTITSTLEGTITDAMGAVVAGAHVTAQSATGGIERSVTSDADGVYRITSLPPGTYSISVSHSGFSARPVDNVALTLNWTLVVDIRLEVAAFVSRVDVQAHAQLLNVTASELGATVTPRQIVDMPVNGRNYLDLMQLVPGVAINKRSTGDDATPVLGERSGNNNYFIDGQPNKDTVSGGPAAQFNQETIGEFQVLTTGYKAEFGQASGAIVNVITKTGGSDFHGVASFFHRNEAFDSVNSLEPNITEPQRLRRFDYTLAGGGPVRRERVFFFGSSERISEGRGIDFTYPVFPATPASLRLLQLLHRQEDPLDSPQRTRDMRHFLKLNEAFERHHLVQELNYANDDNLGTGDGVPSSRRNSATRRPLLGLEDSILLGDRGKPWLLTLRGGFRGERFKNSPVTADIQGLTALHIFAAQQSCPPTCGLFETSADPPAVLFGSADTASHLDQDYLSLSASANKLFGDHDVKLGWQFLRTKVDGVDSHTVVTQRSATVDDYLTFGPVNSGIFTLLESGGRTARADEIHLRNNYNASYAQDDWRIARNLTLNLGVRLDYDSEFGARNVAPRVGFTWTATPKTIIRSHWGIFYDQFRLGLAQRVPAFGGSDRQTSQPLYFHGAFTGLPVWSPVWHLSLVFQAHAFRTS